MNYSFPSLFNFYTPDCKLLLDFNYSCPTDTSTTIIVPTIYLLLQLSFTVFKRSSLSRTKVPHHVIRDLLSSERFQQWVDVSEQWKFNSYNWIYIFFSILPSRMPTWTFLLWINFSSPPLFRLLRIANGSICDVSCFPCLGQTKLTSIKPHIVMDRISTFQALQINIRIN